MAEREGSWFGTPVGIPLYAWYFLPVVFVIIVAIVALAR